MIYFVASFGLRIIGGDRQPMTVTMHRKVFLVLTHWPLSAQCLSLCYSETRSLCIFIQEKNLQTSCFLNLGQSLILTSPYLLLGEEGEEKLDHRYPKQYLCFQFSHSMSLFSSDWLPCSPVALMLGLF
jgi:hypothetical protein